MKKTSSSDLNNFAAALKHSAAVGREQKAGKSAKAGIGQKPAPSRLKGHSTKLKKH